MASTYGRISDNNLSPQMIVRCNECAYTVDHWRKVIKDLDEANKPFDGLRAKLNLGIKRALA